MAEEIVPDLDQLKYTFKNVQLFKNETLGTGSYGAVCKAKCDELLCAAKLLYPVLFQMTTPDPGKEHRHPFRRFESECQFLSLINHPNIVQYLGTYRDPDTSAPVLLMELMDESLTHFLESSPRDIPYHIQVNLANDIAQALVFLHANGIIHRDLSSNNVLLIAGHRAKVTDFGMLKFTDTDVSTRLATMTMCPGTPAFMSPEALNDPPVYTEKLDTFSFGVLTVQIITKKFPKPTDRSRMIEIPNPQNSSCPIQARIAIPERERRKAHIDEIESTHPLLPLALDCLKDKEEERPAASQLCQTLNPLKKTDIYEKSSQEELSVTAQAKDEEIKIKNDQLKAKDEHISKLTGQIENCEEQLRALEKEIVDKDEQIQQKQEGITKVCELLRCRDEQIKFKDDQIHDKELTIQENIKQIEARDSMLRGKNDEIAVNVVLLRARDNEISTMKKQISNMEKQMMELEQQLEIQKKRVNKDEGLFVEVAKHNLQQTNPVKGNNFQFSDLQEENHHLRTGKEDLDRQLQSSIKQNTALQEEIHIKNSNLMELVKQIKANKMDAVVLQEKISELEKQVSELNWSLSCKEEEILILKHQLHQPKPTPTKPLVIEKPCQLAWGALMRAPVIMWAGSACVIEGKAYFWPDWGQIIQQFNPTNKQWIALPPHPFTNFSVVNIDNKLTTVGGLANNRLTNRLYTYNYPTRRWVDNFPAMAFGRATPAVAHSKDTLVVAGGRSSSHLSLNIVEILNTKNSQWYSVSSLPFSPSKLSMTFHDDHFYIATEITSSEGNKFSVIRVSHQALLSSNPSSNAWQYIAALPVRNTSLASVNGHLLAVCGKDSIGVRINAVYEYSQSSDSWRVASQMSTARDSCLTAVLPGNKLMVVGGYELKARRSIEMAIITKLH